MLSATLTCAEPTLLDFHGMNLDLTADQIFMRDEAHRLLVQQADSAALRRAVDAGGIDAGLWRTVSAELGWSGVAIPEDTGGLGLGPMELVLLAEQCGRRLAPVPFWSTACLAAPLIDALMPDPARAALLRRIVAGEAATVALDLSTSPGNGLLAVLAGRTLRGWALSGKVADVVDAPSAAFILVPAMSDDGTLVLVLLDTPSVAPPRPAFDLLRPSASMQFDDVAIPADAIVAAGITPPDFMRALRTARLCLAAEQVGAAQGALDMTVAYIADRVQFGRTIASFQAVKHRCAALIILISEARSLLYGSAASLAGDAAEVDLEIAALGALATDVAFHAAEEAIQLHGGVGNTWEYDPHLFLRRAQASAQLFGSASQRLESVAGALLGAAA